MSLRLSISIALTRAAPHPDARTLAAYCEAIERLGFHAIYFTDHFLYSGPSLHSVSAAAVAIEATERVRVGFAAYVLPLRHPIQAAHEAAMLDVLSGGRLELGVAAGSYAAEFEALGIPFAERGRRFEEGLAALKALWGGERASFAGRFYRFEDVALEPAPVQAPHPPLWIGSWSAVPAAARRIARYGDGWQASGLHTRLEDLAGGRRAIEAACAELGRDPASVRCAYVNAVTHLAARREAAWAEMGGRPSRREPLGIIGTPEDAVGHLRRLQEAGAREVALLLPAWSKEQLHVIAEEVMGEID